MLRKLALCRKRSELLFAKVLTENENLAEKMQCAVHACLCPHVLHPPFRNPDLGTFQETAWNMCPTSSLAAISAYISSHQPTSAHIQDLQISTAYNIQIPSKWGDDTAENRWKFYVQLYSCIT